MYSHVFSPSSFNPKIDRDLAGYEEQSIFCAPICADECVLAVVLLLNKLGDRQFTAEDEDTFAVYANFAGMCPWELLASNCLWYLTFSMKPSDPLELCPGPFSFHLFFTAGNHGRKLK